MSNNLLNTEHLETLVARLKYVNALISIHLTEAPSTPVTALISERYNLRAEIKLLNIHLKL